MNNKKSGALPTRGRICIAIQIKHYENKGKKNQRALDFVSRRTLEVDGLIVIQKLNIQFQSFFLFEPRTLSCVIVPKGIIMSFWVS